MFLTLQTAIEFVTLFSACLPVALVMLAVKDAISMHQQDRG
jgi:hypothetical protein